MVTRTKTEQKTDEESRKKSAHFRRQPLMDLFPPVTPYATGFLQVDEIHTLYWEQSGNPDGVPVVLLHGGPGAGAAPVHRRFFDPDHYRIIIFDQRGAGRSIPQGYLENNTLHHLTQDIETLRDHLKVDRWHVFGGSWGSTLALSYASQYPDKIISLMLRGIFLCEQPEIDWFMNGMKTIFPEAWDQFSKIVPDDQKDTMLEWYVSILNGDDQAKAEDAAIRWSLYEGACSSLLPNYETITTDEQKSRALVLAKMESHYFLNQVISAKDSLLHKVEKFKHITGFIVQGRYDMICPIITAERLHQQWPEADYRVVPDGGHSALDAPIRSQLVEVTEHAKDLR